LDINRMKVAIFVFSVSNFNSNLIMKQFLVIVLIFLQPTFIFSQDQVVFFIQAHADDWQLFMSKNIEEDVSFAKIVIITLTAGDAGHGSLPYGNGKIPYYLAREKGAVYSSKFAGDIMASEVEDIPQCNMLAINNHQIARYSYKNRIVNYFLRLPDGLAGEGVPETGNQSLAKLKNGSLKTVIAVDNSALYKGWTDLMQTLKSIIQKERGADEQVWINTHSSDLKFNEGDHSDHYATAQVVQDVTKDMPWAGIVSWMGYRCRKLPPNLEPKELINASAIFTAYSWSLMESGYGESFDNAHRRFLPNDFSRITKKPDYDSFSDQFNDWKKSFKRKVNQAL